MGQNLTHGVYLPDEGERNCYNGLAANWQILDSSVGTIAEHTSQIAGKAPLVHTHTKADITDFPAYGNAAGTICEGNDSRLSDARTPVAHTHTKSDVTDLLNSNFIPSANNSYDLGSSSYQWNNLYAKNYYYNGVAWGLDKANQWTGDNTFSNAVGFTKVNATTLYAQNARVELGDSGLSGDSYNQISFWDKNGDNLSYLRQNYNTNGTNVLNIFVRNKFLNGVPNTAGTVDYAYFGLVLNADKSKEGVLKASFRPYDNNTHDLGNSSYKWKTLNGVNPGALSLPDYSNALDVTSEIPIASLDGNTQIDISTYLPNKTGWLNIVIADTAGNSIVATQGRSGGSTAYNNSRTIHTGAQSNGYISLFFPILADMNKFVMIKASSLIQMRFYYCLGNV